MRKILLLLIIVIVAIFLSLGPIAKWGINKFGPQALKTDVSVENVDISLINGSVHITGLNIGNPKGFNTPHLLHVAAFNAKVQPASVMSDVIKIDYVVLDGLSVNFEGHLQTNNLKTMKENLAKGDTTNMSSTEAMAQPEEEKEASAGKKVEITKLETKNSKVALHVKGMPEAGVEIALPDILMKDIGKGSGTSAAEATQKVLTQIIVTAQTSALQNWSDLNKNMKKIEDKVKGLTDKFKNLF